MSNIFLKDDEIKALREKYAKDNIYFDVHWITDDKLSVIVGGNQNGKFMLSPKEVYDMFKDNEYFMMELRYLLQNYEEIGYSFEDIINMDSEQLNEMNKKFKESFLSSLDSNVELNNAERKRNR